ncbi:MAG: tetratricopeptide (TPR) repeat protein [Kiritimatiellia bacterium]|jgi:tetratricopeptide (TPR) repeat protein
MAEGHSFSGRERNVCFLNTADGRFCNASAVTGFDFEDDGRALATMDWDFDGDLDVWLFNRSTPRVRYLQNQLASPGRYLLLKLQGTTCNRDAIGARIELNLGAQVITRTVRAGESFLSQGTRWLHVSLPGTNGVHELTVSWPGQGMETVPIPAWNRAYRLVQGRGTLQAWDPPPVKPLHPGALNPPAADASIRVVTAAPVPLPDVNLTLKARPTLLLFWAKWCAPCLSELHAWSSVSVDGLDVLAVNLEFELDDARIEQVLRDTGYRGDAARVDEAGGRMLDLFQRSITELQEPLVLPMAMVLDEHNQLKVLYKGGVLPEVVAADVADIETLSEQATPFPGTWIHPPTGADPLRLAMKLMDEGMYAQADAYLAQSLRLEGLGRSTATRWFARGVVMENAGQLDRAIDLFREAVRADPNYALAFDRMGQLFMHRREWASALDVLDRACRLSPRDPDLLCRMGLTLLAMDEVGGAAGCFQEAIAFQADHQVAGYNYAFCYQRQGRVDDAIALYRGFLQVHPDHALAANNLAWLLATGPGHDPEEAIRLSQRALQAYPEEPAILMTVAAAAAAGGDFDQAVKQVDRAIPHAKGRLLNRLKKHRTRYVNHQILVGPDA